MTRGTLNAAELADVLGVSKWVVYQSVKEGTCPIPPIHVGRRVVFSKAKLNDLLSSGSQWTHDVHSPIDSEVRSYADGPDVQDSRTGEP